MKRILLLALCILLGANLMGCERKLFNTQSSIYNEFSAKDEGNTFQISGDAELTETINILYLAPSEDTSIGMHGKLWDVSDDIQIVYITPNDEATVLFDSRETEGGLFSIDRSIELQEGAGRLEFRGESVNFKFKLTFTDIERDKFDYFSVDKQEADGDRDRTGNENSEGTAGIAEKPAAGTGSGIKNELEDGSQADGGIKVDETENGVSAGLLNKEAVIFTSEDEDDIILDTDLKKDTKVKVSIKVQVSNVLGKEMNFKGFRLIYKTEDGEEIKVLNHKTDEFAGRGYTWEDKFSEVVDLPAGTNELIFYNRGGKNYKIDLTIRVFEIE